MKALDFINVLLRLEPYVLHCSLKIHLYPCKDINSRCRCYFELLATTRAGRDSSKCG
jgi:hypothetical protein